MFRQRTSAQKPGDELLATFRKQFPEVAATTAAPAGVPQAAVDNAAVAPIPGVPLPGFQERSHSLSHEAFRDQDPTPRATNEPWRFTPSLLDPNSFSFTNFANAPPGYYTPTPGGTNTIYHPQAGDLHTPTLGLGMGLGTPLSMPTSEGAMNSGPAMMDLAGFQGMHPQHFQQQFHPFIQPPAPQQSFAPSTFVHQDTGYETMEQDGSPMNSDPSEERMTSIDSAFHNSPMVGFQQGRQFSGMPMAAALPPSAEKFRFHATLNAPTAMIKHADEIPVTYLNKGQAYSLSIVDTNATIPVAPGTKFRTFVRISFEDEQQRQKPGVCWALWKEGRGTNEAHQRGGKLQAVEYVEAGQPTEGDDKRTRIELESASFDGFSVVWTPGINGGPECNIAVRFTERTLFIPTGVNATAKFFGKEREHGQKVVFKPITRSSIYASLQISHGVSACAKTAVSGQLAPGQTQDRRGRNNLQKSGKRTNYQREGSDEEEDKDAPRQKRAKTESSPPVVKKLACPYYRNDPENHRKHRSCAGPGWTSIHRLKEHILRQHALPIHCPRCLTTFNTDKDFKLHIRQAVLCPLSDSTPPEGYNKDQEVALRIKRRGDAEREWVAIYKLLFPGVPEELIPSPYYEDDEMQLELLQRREANRFQRHMELAVPLSVVRLLAQTNFEPSVSLDVPMRTQLVEIVASAVAEASQSYRQRESPPTEAQAPAVLNRSSTLTQHPGTHGAPDSILHLSTSAPTQEPSQPQANVQQHDGLEYELNHSTSVHDGTEHQDNDSQPENELLVDPLLLEMSLFDWNPNQDILFQDP